MSIAVFPGSALPSSGSVQKSVLFNTTAYNANTGDVNALTKNVGTVATGVDTYIKESAITVPTFNVGSSFRWTFVITKTGAGTAAAAFQIRLGTTATVTDTSLFTITLGAQTGVADTGWCEIVVNVMGLV